MGEKVSKNTTDEETGDNPSPGRLPASPPDGLSKVFHMLFSITFVFPFVVLTTKQSRLLSFSP